MHHLQFAETGRYFMKCGTDSPENLLAYDDFDGTPNIRNRRKSWSPHSGHYAAAEAADYAWQTDPIQGKKGTGLLGAVRYLSDQGLNAFSFLTYSIDGDDDNVFPHLIDGALTTYEAGGDINTRWNGDRVHHDRFDVSKIAQWGRIFDYATMKGMYLHFKTQEIENDELMDDPADGIGPERILYFRELVARFGHNLALNWNLGEENSNEDAQRIAFTAWFHDNDPYRHPVVLHTRDNSEQSDYEPMLGMASELAGASLQPADSIPFETVFTDTKRWVVNSAAAGKPWVVACDEPGDAGIGLRPTATAGDNHVNARKNSLWGNPMAGGGGVEWYFGSSANNAHSDLSCQDFASREAFWADCRHMLAFWEASGAPFWEMVNDNALGSAADGFCLFKAGEAYVVYLKSGGNSTINLSAATGGMELWWFDPRNGGNLQQGAVTMLDGGGIRELGLPPSAPAEDWVAFVRTVQANTPPDFPGTTFSSPPDSDLTIPLADILAVASDAEGHPLSLTAASPASTAGGTVTLGAENLIFTPAAGFCGEDSFQVTVSDSFGAATIGTVTIVVELPPGSGDPLLPSITMSGGKAILRFPGVPGTVYTIERSGNLKDWDELHTGPAAEIGVIQCTDPDPPQPRGFYRRRDP